MSVFGVSMTFRGLGEDCVLTTETFSLSRGPAPCVFSNRNVVAIIRLVFAKSMFSQMTTRPAIDVHANKTKRLPKSPRLVSFPHSVSYLFDSCFHWRFLHRRNVSVAINLVTGNRRKLHVTCRRTKDQGIHAVSHRLLMQAIQSDDGEVRLQTLGNCARLFVDPQRSSATWRWPASPALPTTG